MDDGTGVFEGGRPNGGYYGPSLKIDFFVCRGKLPKLDNGFFESKNKDFAHRNGRYIRKLG